MTNITKNEFKPNYAVPPGETLEETLETLGMSLQELAELIGLSVTTINEIIQGKTAITTDTALQLEKVIGVSADFWLRLEQQYRETLARLYEQEQNHLIQAN
jgi:addiction module HigA family antidote